jgi:hypothetical protein
VHFSRWVEKIAMMFVARLPGSDWVGRVGFFGVERVWRAE